MEPFFKPLNSITRIENKFSEVRIFSKSSGKCTDNFSGWFLCPCQKKLPKFKSQPYFHKDLRESVSVWAFGAEKIENLSGLYVRVAEQLLYVDHLKAISVNWHYCISQILEIYHPSRLLWFEFYFCRKDATTTVEAFLYWILRRKYTHRYIFTYHSRPLSRCIHSNYNDID